MSICPSCTSEIPSGGRFCPGCGAPSGTSSQSPTVVAGARSPRSGTAARSFSTPSSLDEGRFAPGKMLGERYRITGLLGRGGMGEVYRADDLTLGQPVALKFLPEAATGDQAKMGRFLGEVRIARQVSHPNVCRVYDIGEAEGQRFLSMEYVDGEDLATLVRRIGRLSPEKAGQIARQVCAGLSAAHDKGVIHRDLKPANVMIDDQGRVRITDFGLASLAGTVEGGEVRAGTPAYMAPEQLAGKEVSVRSDIYALGLVLYELFTGKPAYGPGSLEELRSQRESGTPPSPSTLVPDLDPAVERTILRCLEADPRQRPASALAVAAALPGGDPLAAALAAGETPSPELVAAAGEEGGLKPAAAWALLAGALSGLGLLLLFASPQEMINRVGLQKSPDVLVERSREILARLGYGEEPADRAWWFQVDGDLLDFIRENDESKDRWESLGEGRPRALRFWYRESPAEMVSGEGFGLVTAAEPPLLVPGMTRLVLDPEGRLARFDAVPPERDEPEGASAPPDWSLLFEAAGLDDGLLEPVDPVLVPRVHADTRSAWVGSYPERPGPQIRVEAAAYRGRPVFLRVTGPWTPPDFPLPGTGSSQEDAGALIGPILLLTLIVAGLFLVRRNLRLGRGDARGATKLALAALGIHTIVWALQTHHLPSLGSEMTLLVQSTANTLFLAALIWLFYVALEPFVRRRWPGALIGWSRFLGGGFRDPLVGREILIGVGFGMILAALLAAGRAAPSWLGEPGPEPQGSNLIFLRGIGPAVGQVIDSPLHSLIASMAFLFFFVLLRVILRRTWLAASVLVLMGAAASALGTENVAIAALVGALVSALWVAALVKIGFLAPTVSMAIVQLLEDTPLTTDLLSWYGTGTVAILVAVAALAVYAFRVALAGRPAFSGSLLDD